MNMFRVVAVFLAAAVALSASGAEYDKKGKGKGKGRDDFLLAQAYINAPPTAQATVGRLLVNPFGEVDGVLLDTGTIVTFPPHMNVELAAAVKPGDRVEVKGYPETPTQIKGYVITNSRTNQTVVVHPKPPAGATMPKHLRGAGLKEMSAQGEIRYLRYGGRGEINGLILADGAIVRFPREVSYQFGNLFRIGQTIAVSGYGTQNQYGRALEVTVLRPLGQPPQPLYQR